MILSDEQNYEPIEVCPYCGIVQICPNNCNEKYKGKTFSGFSFCSICKKLETFCKCPEFISRANVQDAVDCTDEGVWSN